MLDSALTADHNTESSCNVLEPMRFAVPVAFFPNGSNHLPAILPNKIPKSKKNPQVRFLSVAEDLNDCDLGVKD
jgi:hypothetical protein